MPDGYHKLLPCYPLISVIRFTSQLKTIIYLSLPPIQGGWMLTLYSTFADLEIALSIHVIE